MSVTGKQIADDFADTHGYPGPLPGREVARVIHLIDDLMLTHAIRRMKEKDYGSCRR